MQVGIARSVCSILFAAGCVLLLRTSVSVAQADPANGGADQDDALAEPFVCVLPDYWPAVNDPQWFVRWAQTEEAEGWRMVPYTTPSGIHVLRIPDAPLTEPGPEVIGAYQKGYADRFLRLLHALSPEQRGLLARGEVVNVTNVRDTVAEMAPHDRDRDGTDRSAEGVLQSCEYIAAALAVVPTVEIRPTGEPGGALCDIDILYSHEPGRIKDVQLRSDGQTFWSVLNPPGLRREGDGSDWMVMPWHLRGPSRDVTATILPDLLDGLEEADKRISLDEINGTKLDRIIADIARWSGIEAQAVGTCTSRVVYAKGGDVTARALAEAVFTSGRLAIRLSEPDGAFLVSEHLSQAWAPSISIAEQARRRTLPEITAELRSLLAPALERPYLAEPPIPLHWFTEGYDGLVSDLPKVEAEWVSGVIREAQGCYAGLPAFDREWLAVSSRLAVRFRLEFQLTVAACTPYGKFDPSSRTRVPTDPPEAYFTELGASPGVPIYSAVHSATRTYRAY